MTCSQCKEKSIITVPLGKDKRHLCKKHYEWYQRYDACYRLKFESANDL